MTWQTNAVTECLNPGCSITTKTNNKIQPNKVHDFDERKSTYLICTREDVFHNGISQEYGVVLDTIAEIINNSCDRTGSSEPFIKWLKTYRSKENSQQYLNKEEHCDVLLLYHWVQFFLARECRTVPCPWICALSEHAQILLYSKRKELFQFKTLNHLTNFAMIRLPNSTASCRVLAGEFRVSHVTASLPNTKEVRCKRKPKLSPVPRAESFLKTKPIFEKEEEKKRTNKTLGISLAMILSVLNVHSFAELGDQFLDNRIRNVCHWNEMWLENMTK